MKKFLTMLLTVVLAVSSLGLFTACGGDEEQQGSNEKIAALICLHGEGSSYDKNFIDAFKAACKAKGLTEEQYTIVVDIPEDEPAYEKAAEFADAGYKVVFGDSFGHEKFLIKAAKEFPNVQFCHATGTAGGFLNTEDTSDDAPANFHNAFASIYEGRYLAGVAAGLKLIELYGEDITADEAKIGYVGAWPFAEVKSGLTSFYLGVKSIVPNTTMEVRFTNSWYDPVAEQTAAEALIQGGAKLVSGHADSYGVPTACKNANVPNVFYNGTTNEDTFVIASKINWQPYFEHMLDGVMVEGKSIEKDYCGTLENGSVQITALGKAAAEGTQTKLDEVKAKLMSGEIKVFDCATFTVNGAPLTEYLADVVDTGDFTGETNVVKTEGGKTYFAESEFRSAPYFDLIIDGITVGADVVTPVK
ncbi:MAG: BMP family ABC transporter substrate-binding protein [Clostridia bacterium]|nr:BMP family ABC transporter substrate-binding protein [Clostridia bacterium]